MSLVSLSKREFEALGCDDVPAKQLRARVFNLEGLSSELALALQDMLDCFAPDENGWLALESEKERMCVWRAREALHAAKNTLVGVYNEEGATDTLDTEADR